MKTHFDSLMAFLIDRADREIRRDRPQARTLAYREAMIDGWVMGVVNYSTVRAICSAPVVTSDAQRRYAAYADHVETASVVDSHCLPSVA